MLPAIDSLDLSTLHSADAQVTSYKHDKRIKKRNEKNKRELMEVSCWAIITNNATILCRSTHFNLHLWLNQRCRHATRVHGCNNGCVTVHKFIRYLLCISCGLMRKRDNLEDATKAQRSSAIARWPKTIENNNERCTSPMKQNMFRIFKRDGFFPRRE